MTTYLGKSCSFGLARVPFINCRQFMYLVISLLVLRAGCGIWLYQFLIIAYLFTLMYSDNISNHWYNRPKKHNAYLTYPTPKRKWAKMEIFVAMNTHSTVLYTNSHSIKSSCDKNTTFCVINTSDSSKIFWDMAPLSLFIDWPSYNRKYCSCD